MKQLDLVLARPKRVDVDRVVDEKAGVVFLGQAVQQFNGRYVCLANVGGTLCLVQVSVTEPKAKEKSA